jgi:hypothetical protein
MAGLEFMHMKTSEDTSMRGFVTSKPGRLLSFLFFLSAVPFLAGCGSSKVSGKVTYQGKTVPGGMVVFYGADNWTGNSPIEKDGSYTIPKVPPVMMKITADTSSLRPVRMPMGAPKMPNLQKNPPPDLPEQAKENPLYNPNLNADRYLPIPPKYADRELSGLTYEVTSGTQIHDIKLD